MKQQGQETGSRTVMTLRGNDIGVRRFGFFDENIHNSIYHTAVLAGALMAAAAGRNRFLPDKTVSESMDAGCSASAASESAAAVLESGSGPAPIT